MNRRFEVTVSNLVHRAPDGSELAMGVLSAHVDATDTAGMRREIEKCALAHVVDNDITPPVTITIELVPTVIE